MYFQPALWLLIVQYPQTDRNKEELGASPPPAVQQGSVYQGKPKTSSDFAIGITVISFKEEETMKKSLVITAVGSFPVGVLRGGVLVRPSPCFSFRAGWQNGRIRGESSHPRKGREHYSRAMHRAT